MPSPIIDGLVISDISPLEMCTPVHKFEFIALEDLENPLTTPNNVSVNKLANLDVKID